MNREWWKALIALMWLALPLIALRYWLAWDRLPARLATHFDAAGNANGWMAPEKSLTFALVIITVMVVVFTIVLTQVRKGEAFSWGMLGFSYVLVGVMVYANESILSYNLNGNPVHPWPVLIAVVIASGALVVGILGTKRGTNLSCTNVMAEEVHASGFWSLVLGVPAGVELLVTAMSRNMGLRIGMGVGAAVLLLAATLAWSGFRYIFSDAGLEIRTFGFRLQSIPVDQIREYAADRWSVTGGYGIRGLGDCRAYVWGNKGVRIKTGTGQVFLGHRDPQRLLHDLDAIKRFAH
jgi:hypothetical protein